MPPSSRRSSARTGHRAQTRREGTPLYTIERGRGGREAIVDFAARNWRTQHKIVGVLGPLSAQAEGIPERVQGVTEGLKRQLPSTRVVMLDTQGNPAQVGALLGKLLSAQPTAKILIAATDDQTALAAKAGSSQPGGSFCAIGATRDRRSRQ